MDIRQSTGNIQKQYNCLTTKGLCLVLMVPGLERNIIKAFSSFFAALNCDRLGTIPNCTKDKWRRLWFFAFH